MSQWQEVQEHLVALEPECAANVDRLLADVW